MNQIEFMDKVFIKAMDTTFKTTLTTEKRIEMAWAIAVVALEQRIKIHSKMLK